LKTFFKKKDEEIKVTNRPKSFQNLPKSFQMSEVEVEVVLANIRMICYNIDCDNPIDLHTPMLKHIYRISCIGDNGIVPASTHHYIALLAELRYYRESCGVTRTPDSKKCINRIKYRAKAINNLEQAFLEKLTFKIDDCPCCYEEITNTNVSVLECNHLLCGACVTQIKDRNNACPICREELVVISYK